jgi:hypothetical protein
MADMQLDWRIVFLMLLHCNVSTAFCELAFRLIRIHMRASTQRSSLTQQGASDLAHSAGAWGQPIRMLVKIISQNTTYHSDDSIAHDGVVDGLAIGVCQ